MSLERLSSAWTLRQKVLIGMCHVPPLPGSPRFAGSIEDVREHVLRDAEALAQGGADGIFLENFGDVPFYPDRVPPVTLVHLALLADELRSHTKLPLGINVLRNDGRSALVIANGVGAEFIRVNVLCHARLTDQGVIQSIAHDLLRDRTTLGATRIRILADVNVKESVPLSPGLSIEDETDDLIHRGLADGVIVSGANTGSGADVEELQRVRQVAGRIPVFVGSGVSIDNIQRFLPLADGFIVGTSLKVDGMTSNPVDVQRVRTLAAMIR
jgi:membrane complex biogenesis BtpA family protein